MCNDILTFVYQYIFLSYMNVYIFLNIFIVATNPNFLLHLSIPLFVAFPSRSMTMVRHNAWKHQRSHPCHALWRVNDVGSVNIVGRAWQVGLRWNSLLAFWRVVTLTANLGGVFKHFFFSSLSGEDSNFD